MLDNGKNWLYYCIRTVIQGGVTMAWHFAPDRPVYLQIARRITQSVLSGKYLPGEQIPAVRQLALEAAVNPNTVQHAFAELESDGLILSKGTLGRFVTEEQAVIENCRKKLARQAVNDFLKNMSNLSISKEEAIALMKEAEE